MTRRGAGYGLSTTILAGLMALGAGIGGEAAAQTPPPPPSAEAPAAPPVAPVPAPVAPTATSPVAPPAAASVLPPDEAIQSAGFGDEVTLAARPALVLTGKTSWDDLYGTFRKAIADLKVIAAREGAVISGPPMIRFVSSSDDAVDYEAILPVREVAKPAAAYAPAGPGQTPAGRAVRFVHRGGYDTMEQTYDEITNHLDVQSITAEDAFVEEYVRDPDQTPETDMATFIYVFPKTN
ncbi:MAG: GyrI-like domain-containing protein [Phreatobacter sp.]|uniref:GyrI-like domain-containing protein n=1 Tax=Phreatobacter sp. TaxID=1966341 RepID=UPI002734A025|nr:GyrI-like domain-containing protein [Phreatobacter sp.]MDP2803382.1 GyrI-like domain-containing protein [Phreatobacter sp.]